MKYIIKRYLKITPNSDIYEIYHLVILEKGLVSKLEEAGVDLGTLEDWAKARNMGVDVKRAVLRVALENAPIDTLVLMARLMMSRVVELYSTALEVIYHSVADGRSDKELIEKYMAIKGEVGVSVASKISRLIHDIDVLLSGLDTTSPPYTSTR